MGKKKKRKQEEVVEEEIVEEEEEETTKDFEVLAIGQYHAFNIKNNKSVDLVLKFSFEEKINIVQTIAFVVQNVEVFAKKGANKAVKLGLFNFHELKIDRDGEATIKFNSEVDYVYVENVNEIVGKDELLKIRMVANIIMEDSIND